MADNRKRTPWFSGDQKPVHIGIYERGIDGTPFPHPFYVWDGQEWVGMGGTTPQTVVGRNPSIWQSIAWRGLADNPEGAK